MPDVFGLYGLYELPVSIGVTAGCLGKSFPIKVGNQRGRMTLPQLEWDGERPKLIAPTMDAGLSPYVSRLAEQAASRVDRFDYWGKVPGWHSVTHAIDGAFVGVIWIAFRVPLDAITHGPSSGRRGRPEGVVTEALLGDIDRWFDDLRTWAEVLTDQDLDASSRLETSRVPGSGLSLFTYDGTEASVSATPSRIHVFLREIEELTVRPVRKTVRAANARSRPSDAHMLIRDARAALRRNQARRAVIDAATAVELTLADFNARVTKAKPSHGPPTLGWYVKNQTIVRQAKLPSTLSTVLVKVRNDGVHKNRVPTHPDAFAAVSLAKQVVDSLAPLPL